MSEGFRVLFVPGGYANNYEDALGDVGAAHVHAFLRGGGGYVGECAGAYLGAEEYLGLLPSVGITDMDHWARGWVHPRPHPRPHPHPHPSSLTLTLTFTLLVPHTSSPAFGSSLTPDLLPPLDTSKCQRRLAPS